MTTIRLTAFWMAGALGATLAFGATGCELITAVDRNKIAVPPAFDGSGAGGSGGQPVPDAASDAPDDVELGDDAATDDAELDDAAPDGAELDDAADGAAPGEDVTSDGNLLDAGADVAIDASVDAPALPGADGAADGGDGGDAGDRDAGAEADALLGPDGAL